MNTIHITDTALACHGKAMKNFQPADFECLTEMEHSDMVT